MLQLQRTDQKQQAESISNGSQLVDQKVQKIVLTLNSKKYIKTKMTKYVKNITSIKDQGNLGVCYSMSSATHIRNEQKRNNLNLQQHDNLAKKIQSYGYQENGTIEGATDPQMINFIQKSLGQSYQVYYIKDRTQISNDLRQDMCPIINYTLPNQQWKNFQTYFQENPRRVFNLPLKGGSTGHSCIIVGEAQDYYVVKNSWGKLWGDKGLFRISKSSVYPGINCVLISSKTKIPTQTDQLIKKYADRKNNIKYSGRIKQGGNISEKETYMYTKKKEDDHLISQQKDLIGIEHKNINKINSIHFDRSKDQHILISNKYDHNLQDRFKRGDNISGLERAYIGRDCLEGLSYLQRKYHRNHGDIHAQNIVFDRNSKIAKLNDFDMSSKYDTNDFRSKALFDLAKAKDTKNLTETLFYDKSRFRSQRQFREAKKILQNNQSNHLKAKNALQDLILQNYREQCRFQKKVCVLSTVFNAWQAFSHKKSSGYGNSDASKEAVRQVLKGASGLGVQYFSQKSVQKTILQSFDKSNYRLSFSSEVGYNLLTQTIKQIINYTTMNEKQRSNVRFLSSIKKIGAKVFEYGVNKKVIQYGSKVFNQPSKLVQNFSSNSGGAIGKSVIFTNGLRSFVKSNAISSAATFVTGTVFDICRGKNIGQAIKQNGKSSLGSFIGSAVGASIGSVIPCVGTAVGGFVGSMIGSCFGGKIYETVSSFASKVSSFFSSIFG